MELTPEVKDKIDGLSCMELLREARYAPVGDDRFQGSAGRYWLDRLAQVRDADPVEYVRCSKAL